MIQNILAGIFFKPFAKSIPSFLLVLLTFAGSGLLHMYPLYLAGLNGHGLFTHFSFFFCQGMAVIFESIVIPNVNNRLWPAFFLCLTCPLFITPVLEMEWF